MDRVYTLFFFLFAFYSFASSQEVIRHQFSLNWSETDPLKFEGAGEFSGDSRLPVYTYRFPISGKATLSTSLSVSSSVAVTLNSLIPGIDIPKKPILGGVTEQDRGKWYARIWLVPIISNGGNPQKILSGEITITLEKQNESVNRSGPEYKETSVLSTGIIHRIRISKTGVYKIDFAFIKDKLNIDPASISPSRFALYGNGSGRVPQANNDVRIDDLEETFMTGSGLEDGKFDQGDYFLFYAEGPDTWTYLPQERVYSMNKNIYDENNHYYLIINGPERNNMQQRNDTGAGVYESSASLNFQRVEEDKVNLLGRYRPPGSGQEWYGDELSVIDQLDYTSKFDLTDIIASDTIYYKARFAVRSGSVSRFHIYFNEREFNRPVGSVNLGSFESSFAALGLLQGSFKPADKLDQIRIRYPDANGINSRAWIDYLELNIWKENNYRPGKPLFITDPRSLHLGAPQYKISGLPDGGQIWDVTNPLQPVRQNFIPGAIKSFSVSSNGTLPNLFIAFSPDDALIPEYEKEIANQNLHAIHRADMLIVYYDEFKDAALKIAEHRSTHSNLEALAIPVSQIFEEFSGGSVDPTAIRDFARMIYKRDSRFLYLLLLGDATYDYLNKFTEIPYHNFVPAWETPESLHPITSFPADDYFALLDDDEGKNLTGALDIAVGRLPVTSADEAMGVVDKIIHYDTNPVTLNDWRQRIAIVADDEDTNLHLKQADNISVETALEHPELNINKIYLDAYPQESTPGGDRYPDVNSDIDLHMKKGALTFTYMGHGGQNGWAQERVIGINQAQSYDNKDNMPLFITATCSFAGFDEPSYKTAGEHLLTNPNGGAIALMTTVRAVYAGANERLTRNVMESIYKEDLSGTHPGISEILRKAKNVGIDTSEVNARKFTVLGDPSMVLAFPRFDIAVTSINGNAVDASLPDTLSALEKSTIAGSILGDDGQVLTDFNGKIFLTVFDKVQIKKTLANDEDSQERPFSIQNRQLFKGAATVQNGEWSIEFVLPKDLDFSYGAGKMSFYAHNDIVDAAGFFTSFIIGGVSTEGLSDDQPPVVQLFMNDENFVTGGITDANPDIYVLLMDDNGINVSGTGIGHDIEAVLDSDDQNSFILNDFYQAVLDNYRSGEVRYPLNDLAPGKHTLKVTAWDLANNPGEAYLEFLVLDDEGAVLEHVLNYPNPFTSSTYFQFEHNRPGIEMDIQIQIYTVNGRLVKTIERNDFTPDGYRVDDISWDGLDDSGGQLAKGIYVYKINVTYRVNNQQDIVVSKAEKLVILR